MALAAGLLFPGLGSAQAAEPADLTEAQMEELVQRCYQYVAMFNVNNKFALDTDNPMCTRGYNRVFASTDPGRPYPAGDCTTKQRHALCRRHGRRDRGAGRDGDAGL